MTVEGKVGIKETKDVLKFGILAEDAIAAAKADGKIGFEDLGLVVGLVGPLNGAIEGADQIPAELADLDAGEFDELVAVAKETVNDFTPDDWEAYVWAQIAAAKEFLIAIKLIQS
jgi:hypothetical protein